MLYGLEKNYKIRKECTQKHAIVQNRRDLSKIHGVTVIGAVWSV